jgi:hypothetical protein
MAVVERRVPETLGRVHPGGQSIGSGGGERVVGTRGDRRVARRQAVNFSTSQNRSCSAMTRSASGKKCPGFTAKRIGPEWAPM